eukprot:6242-Heterococcus_DN1.PRE.2
MKCMCAVIFVNSPLMTLPLDAIGNIVIVLTCNCNMSSLRKRPAHQQCTPTTKGTVAHCPSTRTHDSGHQQVDNICNL